ncbi:MAG: hypothetical protein UT02_C0013G0002 [Parcubacteria group bacterium GW2011_GWC2_38_7]|nr:MAG: hypothetical protein UT02_C0013G0002 [Parcubacteria group bacterium GW2011_GWC2_38_7]
MKLYHNILQKSTTRLNLVKITQKMRRKQKFLFLTYLLPKMI